MITCLINETKVHFLFCRASTALFRRPTGWECWVALIFIITLDAECPETHPIAFDDGSKCCAEPYRKSDLLSKLEFNDGESECEIGNTAMCSNPPCTRLASAKSMYQRQFQFENS